GEIVGRGQAVADPIHSDAGIGTVLVVLMDILEEYGSAPQVFDIVVITHPQYVFVGAFSTFVLCVGGVWRIAAVAAEGGEVVIECYGVPIGDPVVERGGGQPFIIAVFIAAARALAAGSTGGFRIAEPIKSGADSVDV